MPVDLFHGLNESQCQAVTAESGPVLVLAGAGSGKTRVITHRIAHLIRERGVAPRDVVAVTFTNKAAREMMDRVARLLGLPEEMPPWSPATPRLGTFHGFCLRLLRDEAELLGYKPGFVVYDSDDSKGLVRACLKELHIDDKAYPPGRVLGRIGEAKDRLHTPRKMLEAAGDPDTETMGQVYLRYQQRLRQANAMDFDDLIMKTLELFRDHPERLAHHAAGCHHLLVDEFQDTNRSQYRLVRQLASTHGNVVVVGDEDQSIYRFRGADITNILNFEKDFKGALLIRLERNYRSTGNILAAASSVVANNHERIGKTLYTEEGKGELLTLFQAGTERDEAAWVMDEIRRLEREEDLELPDAAILYRANFQSRPFEEALTRLRIPYTIFGSVRFYERREVKDILCYLRLLHNPDDDLALQRILNVPARKIGKTSLATLDNLRRERGTSLFTALRSAVEEKLFPARGHGALAGFLDMMEELRSGMKGQPMRNLMEDVMQRTSYLEYLERAEPLTFQDRTANLEALATAADEAEREHLGLQGFLDRTALTSATDSADGKGGIALMTLHCAKGLEFPVVFIAGMEERLFPHARSAETLSGIEEERRLFYVGITRAMKRLSLTYASMRSIYGRMQLAEPSRFLEEIPKDVIRMEASAAHGLPAAMAARRGERRAPASGRIVIDASDDTDLPFSGRSRRSSGPSLRRSSREAVNASGAAAAARDAAARGPVVSRGAGAGGEVTVEYDPDGDPDAFTPDDFRIGMDVLHGKYGRGTILQKEGSGPLVKLTVSFPGFGRKRLMARYAKLRVAL